MAFIVPLTSLTAACDRSVRVASGASRLCLSSKRFLESDLFIVLAPSFFDRFQFIRCFFIGRSSGLTAIPLPPGCRCRGSQSAVSHLWFDNSSRLSASQGSAHRL